MNVPRELQVVRCHCGKIFAACVAPECYTDVDWMRDVRKYASKGMKVCIIDTDDFKFEECTCVKAEPTKQLELF